MARILAFGSPGSTAYAVFFGTFLYAIGFRYRLHRSQDDRHRPGRTGRGGLRRQHRADVAVRGPAQRHGAQPFKRWWTRFVPPAIERSTYVLSRASR